MALEKILKFLRSNSFDKKLIIIRQTWRVFNRHKFGKCGRKTYIYQPIFLSGTRHIFLGNEVEIWNNARIEAVQSYNGQTFSPEIHVGDRVKINQDCHITCGERIEIGDDTVCAARVTITDINHDLSTEYKNVVSGGTISTKKTKIGESCFLGNNVVILPGVTVGDFCVIGANSVVGHDIPDYSIAYGNPAKVVRKRI